VSLPAAPLVGGLLASTGVPLTCEALWLSGVQGVCTQYLCKNANSVTKILGNRGVYPQVVAFRRRAGGLARDSTILDALPLSAYVRALLAIRFGGVSPDMKSRTDMGRLAELEDSRLGLGMIQYLVGQRAWSPTASSSPEVHDVYEAK
jgi:hypothetical protein